jgi:hypothetical protein
MVLIATPAITKHEAESCWMSCHRKSISCAALQTLPSRDARERLAVHARENITLIGLRLPRDQHGKQFPQQQPGINPVLISHLPAKNPPGTVSP